MLVKGKLNIYYHKLKVKTDTNTFLKFNFHKDFQEYYKVLSNFNVNLNLWRQVLRAIPLVMVKMGEITLAHKQCFRWIGLDG